MHMKKTTLYLFAALLVGAVIYSCNSANKEAEENATEEPAAMTTDEMIAHGKYIVSTSGCNDCHTPKIFNEQGMSLDMSKMLSGHPAGSVLAPYDKKMVGPWILFAPDLTAYIGPWGVSYSANLTPHESGLGNWTEEQFMTAIKTGKHLGMDNQRPIMPPMPWQEIKNMTDEDMKCVFAYLKSIPPVDNVVPAYEPPTPM